MTDWETLLIKTIRYYESSISVGVIFTYERFLPDKLLIGSEIGLICYRVTS